MKLLRLYSGLAAMLFLLCGCSGGDNTPSSGNLIVSSVSESAEESVRGQESTFSAISSAGSALLPESSSVSEREKPSASSYMTDKTESEDDKDVYGERYQVKNDTFYQKQKIYVTWLNVWNGSTEFWWSGLASSTSVNGTLGNINGEYVCIDSNKASHRESIAKDAFDAGIDALVMDLTNGYSGWTPGAKHYQQLCYENNKKFAAAVHPRNADDLEQICGYMWRTYAGPGEALYSSSYLYKDDKPLLVLYCTENEYTHSVASTGTYSQKFTFVWASGEDSRQNKWGWQIEPQDGPMLSDDSMYLTPSVSWNSPRGSVHSWRSSLAMLDFCFLAEKEAKPRFSIVGSMDDIFERNGWMRLDTTKAFYQKVLEPNPITGVPAPGLQKRDADGNISRTVYYDRVKSWIKGTAKPFYSGGVIPDGAYTVASKASGRQFGVTRPSPGCQEDIGACFYRNQYLSTDMEQYYWFYHLGNNEYRIIKLTSGLSLQADANGKVTQEWTEASDAQRWRLEKQSGGNFLLRNKQTGMALCDGAADGEMITASLAGTGWSLTPVKNRIIG